MLDDVKGEIGMSGQALAGAKLNAHSKHQHMFKVECFSKKTGKLKWVDTIENLVTNEGLDEILDKFYKGSGYTASFFVGLTDGTPTFAAGDTAATIGDSSTEWAEVTDYDEATRQALTLGSVSGQSVDNSASKAVFTIDSDATTIGGAFIITNNTKGGSAGELIGGGAFTAGDKSLDDDDVLNVTVTCTAATA